MATVGYALLAVGALVWSSGVANETPTPKVCGLLFVGLSAPLMLGLV